MIRNAVIASFILLATGCGSVSSHDTVYSKSSTTGRELIDLQEARAKGAISDEEYIKLKRKIMEGELEKK